MKRLMVWLCVLALALTGLTFPSEVKAGGDVCGEITVSELQTNTAICGDTEVYIDRDSVNSEQSISGNYHLHFRSDANHFLHFKANYGCAVSAASITFAEDTAILYPAGGKVSDDGKKIVKADGTDAREVVLGPSDCYVVSKGSFYASDVKKEEQRRIFMAQGSTMFMDEDLDLDWITDLGMDRALAIGESSGKQASLFVINGGERPAISVSYLNFDSTITISDPPDWVIQNGSVFDSEGYEMTTVILKAAGKYKINATFCKADNSNEKIACNTANEGDTVNVHAYSTPGGKYCDSVTSPDVTFQQTLDSEGEPCWTFKMPGKNISVAAVMKDQQPHTFDLRPADAIGTVEEELLLHSLNATLSYHTANVTIKDGKRYFDLDGNGTDDIVEESLNHYAVTNTCNLDKWVSPDVSGVKYTPLTFLFKPKTRKVSFDANGGTGTMAAVNVEKGSKYKLPACTFTAPAGMEFDKWDQGKTGTEITVNADITVKAQWKAKPDNPGEGDPTAPAPGPYVAPDGTEYEIGADGTTAAYTAPAAGVSDVTVPGTITVGTQVVQVTEIKAKAFYKNKKLKKITVGANIRKIGESAFEGCVKLKTVKGGKGLAEIGKRAFYGCKALGEFTFWGKVKKIGASAYEKCVKLKNLIFKTKLLTKNGFGKKCFLDIHPQVKTKCPKKQLKNYENWMKSRGKAPKTGKWTK